MSSAGRKITVLYIKLELRLGTSRFAKSGLTPPEIGRPGFVGHRNAAIKYHQENKTSCLSDVSEADRCFLCFVTTL